MAAQLVIEPTQHLLATQHDRDVAAEAAQQAREFERDVAAALHDDAARLLAPVEELVRARRQVGPGNVLRHQR